MSFDNPRIARTAFAAAAGWLALCAHPAEAANLSRSLGGPVAEVVVGSGAVVFHPLEQSSAVRLVVAGEGDFVFDRVFAAGETPVFRLEEAGAGALAGSSYTYELTALPAVSPELRALLEMARMNEDGAAVVESLRESGELPAAPRVQSGYLRTDGGAFVVPRLEPEEAGLARTGEPADVESVEALAAAGTGGPLDHIAAPDFLVNDDLIVSQNACVGTSCVNGESFGTDTLRLKETTLRIKFQDTSVGAFPTRDWQLTANDSASGGANKFSIDDVDGSKTPFTLEANAPSHSLYVDDAGRVGLGTSTPVAELHFKRGDTPTLRLEQDGSASFEPQTWDIGGNEVNLFVRDVTSGSTLPFKIRPGAPSDSLFIEGTTGDLGVGTPAPTAPVHVRRTGSTEVALLLETGGSTTRFRINNLSATGSWSVGQRQNDTFSIIRDGSGGNDEFSIEPDGDVLVDGVVVHSSSRALKKDIVAVDPSEVLKRVRSLPIAHWTYLDNADGARHLGPMAEDFRGLFGLGSDDAHIATADTAGVALAAIQGLSAEVEALKTERESLREELRDLRALVERLAAQ